MVEFVVHNNIEANRFEVNLAGKIGYLEYELDDAEILLLHTEVPPELEGQGIGSALARAGLEYARDHNLKVVSYCSFVTGYLVKHPEYRDMVKGM